MKGKGGKDDSKRQHAIIACGDSTDATGPEQKTKVKHTKISKSSKNVIVRRIKSGGAGSQINSYHHSTTNNKEPKLAHNQSGYYGQNEQVAQAGTSKSTTTSTKVDKNSR